MFDVKNKNKVNLRRGYDEKLEWNCLFIILIVCFMEFFKYIERVLY